MAITAKDVLQRARIILQDGSSARWTLDELRLWINMGLSQIHFYKPNACTKTILIDMAQGTYQELAEGRQMVRVVRNITSAVGVTPRVAGKTVTPIERGILDLQYPNWHNTSGVPFSAVVTHVVSDEVADPRVFYVFPGNDGTGRIEAVISEAPAEIAAPGDINDIDAYTATLDISPDYLPVLLDFVLSMALTKDIGLPGAAERAVAHRNAFAQALGIRAQVETVATINQTGPAPTG